MAWELLVGARPFPIVFAARVEAMRAGVKPPPSAADSDRGAALVKAMAYVAARSLRVDARADRRDARRARRAGDHREDQAGATARRATARLRSPASSCSACSGIAIGAWMFCARAAAARRAASTVEQPKPAPSPAVDHAIVPPAPAPVDAPPAPVPPATLVETVKAKPRGRDRRRRPHRSPRRRQRPAVSTRAERRVDDGGRQVGADRAHGVSARPHYCRSCMVASMDAFCQIPMDAAHSPARLRDVADWGKVIKVEDELGEFRDEQITETVITRRRASATPTGSMPTSSTSTSMPTSATGSRSASRTRTTTSTSCRVVRPGARTR